MHGKCREDDGAVHARVVLDRRDEVGERGAEVRGRRREALRARAASEKRIARGKPVGILRVGILRGVVAPGTPS